MVCNTSTELKSCTHITILVLSLLCVCTRCALFHPKIRRSLYIPLNIMRAKNLHSERITKSNQKTIYMLEYEVFTFTIFITAIETWSNFNLMHKQTCIPKWCQTKKEECFNRLNQWHAYKQVTYYSVPPVIYVPLSLRNIYAMTPRSIGFLITKFNLCEKVMFFFWIFFSRIDDHTFVFSLYVAITAE